MGRTIRIGTRKSALAMAQTNLFIERIRQADPSVICEIVPLVTKGDKILDRPLLSFGGKGAFVSEFEQALWNRTIDFAVHSAKDMPMETGEGLDVIAVLPRADARDVFITAKGREKEVKVVGTSSLRRQFQIEARYPVTCKDIRGNVETRLEKLKAGQYDAIVLAAAGLSRLGINEDAGYGFTYLEAEQFIPAGGQGIIAIEGRKDDPLSEFVHTISEPDAMVCLETERYVLSLLNAGCHAPVGVYAKLNGNKLSLYLFYKGRRKTGTYRISGNVEDRIELAKTIVEMIED